MSLFFKAPRTWRKRFAILQDTVNLSEICSQQNSIRPNIQPYLQPLEPKIPDWQHLTFTDGSVIISNNKIAQQAGASFFISIGINSSTTSSTTTTCTINAKGPGPTYTTHRAELAAILVALQQGHASVAPDSPSAVNQIRNQILKPMDMYAHTPTCRNSPRHINPYSYDTSPCAFS